MGNRPSFLFVNTLIIFSLCLKYITKRVDKVKLTVYNLLMDRKEMLELRLNGHTYASIAKLAGVSRQRIHAQLSPSRQIRDYVNHKFGGACNRCGLWVGKSGHVHHFLDAYQDEYNEIDNLELLCLSCHRKAHGMPKPKVVIREKIIERIIPTPKMEHPDNLLTIKQATLELGIGVATFYRWQKQSKINTIKMFGRTLVPISEISRLKKGG